jgi:VWFA-related protein
MKALTALCFGLAVAAAPSFAQQPGSQTFRSTTEAVEIDVRVLDSDGRLVPGLTASDFEVFEDGVRQSIRAFTPVTVPLEPRPRRLAVEPDVQSNRVPFNGRVYAFVLDDVHTHPQRTQRVRAVMRQFLDRHFAANDRAAIVTTSGRIDTVQDLTSSRAALLSAVDAFTGQQLRTSALERIDQYFRFAQTGQIKERGNQDNREVRVTDPLEPERAFNARRALRSLQEVARWLETVPARRKALIFISEGIDYDLRNLTENRFAGGLLADVREAIASATRSNANIYTIDPRGLGGLADETIELASMPDDTTVLRPGIFMEALQWTQDNLRILSEESGGFAILNTNDLDRGFARLVRENTEYYLIGYQPTNIRRDGRFRRIDVRVARPGLSIVARRGYFAPSDARRRPVNDLNGMRALLDSPVPVTGLTLESAVTMFRGDGDRVSVLATIEVGPQVTLIDNGGLHKGKIRFTVVALDMDGRIVESVSPVLDLNLRPTTRDAVMTHGLRTTTRLELKPGRYQLRIAARDMNGDKGGSVMHELRVPDFREAPIAMSQMLLASRGAARVATTNVDPILQDMLAAPPTTIREFDRTDTLTVLAEIYDNRKRGTDPVTLLTAISDSDGRVRYRLEEDIDGFAFEPSRKSYRHRVDIPLGELQPGDYVLRLAARPEKGEAAKIQREIAFSVREQDTVALH